MESGWEKIDNVRKTDFALSGSHYSLQYAQEHGMMKECKALSYGKHPSVGIIEPVEVSLDKNHEVLCKFAEGGWKREQKETFVTSLGTFISHNCGEFGGELRMPKGRIGGNFIEVFECLGKTYGIDSGSHLGMEHINIYRFSKNSAPVKLFSSDTLSLSGSSELISCKAVYQAENAAYILASGRIHTQGKDEQPRSYLFEISGNGFAKKAELECYFGYVYNMIVYDETMILGMDKIAAVVDLKTKEIEAHTPISIEAELDILELKEAWEAN